MIQKKKKPVFNRTDFNKKKFKNKWRKPRGIHNKIRIGFKGHQKKPGVGYRNPKNIRNKNKKGLEIKRVNNLNELKIINKYEEAIVLNSSIGLKKRLDILKEAKKLKINVSNIKNIDEFISKKEKFLEGKQKLKKKKVAEKKKREEKAKEKKPKEKEKKSEDEIKKEVMKSDIKEPIHKQRIAKKPKEQKVDSVRQQIVAGGKT